MSQRRARRLACKAIESGVIECERIWHTSMPVFPRCDRRCRFYNFTRKSLASGMPGYSRGGFGRGGGSWKGLVRGWHWLGIWESRESRRVERHAGDYRDRSFLSMSREYPIWWNIVAPALPLPYLPQLRGGSWSREGPGEPPKERPIEFLVELVNLPKPPVSFVQSCPSGYSVRLFSSPNSSFHFHCVTFATGGGTGQNGHLGQNGTVRSGSLSSRSHGVTRSKMLFVEYTCKTELLRMVEHLRQVLL